MTALYKYDALVVGGGPAGSVSARVLHQRGLRVAVLDRKQFPRVKLCAGWLSPAVWDVLELRPSEYPAGLWEWKRCHVQHGGECHTVDGSGHFIRRYEFDDFLLRRSGADVIEHSVRKIERRDGEWLLDGTYAARYLVGAAGTHCPVARQLFPKKPARPVGAQEHEFVAGADSVARTRVGNDGEPELLLHDDLGGYSWNVPKGEWLNLGTGTSEPREVLSSWAKARDFFVSAGHVPGAAEEQLNHAAGHSYYLFHPEHLAVCEKDGAFTVGDGLGLAHPLTAEGILPSILSGRLAAEAIVAGEPGRYKRELEAHPIIRDYTLAYELLRIGIELRGRLSGRSLPGPRLPQLPQLTRLSRAATARGFAWMFSGRPIPYGPALRMGLRAARSLRSTR